MTLTQANAKIAELIERVNQMGIGTLCVENIQSRINQFDLVLIADAKNEFNLKVRYTFDVLEIEAWEDSWEELDDLSLMTYLFKETMERIKIGWII